MATRAIVRIMDGFAPYRILSAAYRHWDGYPDGLGKEIADFSKDFRIVNGLVRAEAGSDIANGMGCFGAMLFGYLKGDIPGNVYLTHPDDRAIGEEYIYTVFTRDGAVGLRCVYAYGGEILFHDLARCFDPYEVERRTFRLTRCDDPGFAEYGLSEIETAEDGVALEARPDALGEGHESYELDLAPNWTSEAILARLPQVTRTASVGFSTIGDDYTETDFPPDDDTSMDGRSCSTCRYWSEMAAEAHDSGVRAMCLSDDGPLKRTYVPDGGQCPAWAENLYGAVDGPPDFGERARAEYAKEADSQPTPAAGNGSGGVKAN